MIEPGMEFFLDPSRCIGCQACYHACAECDTHRGVSMIHLEYTDRAASPQTVPVVCMHCEDPACAEVCPADAIKKTPDGVVQSALASHCIGCMNCVLACPFGVPRYVPQFDLMMKCDMCYDRTSAGKRPMCVTVCPSGALAYGPRAEIEALRRERPVNTFIFGPQVVQTKVHMMLPAGVEALEVDVTAFMTSEEGTMPLLSPLPEGEGAKSCVAYPKSLLYIDGKGASMPEVPTWKEHFPISWVDDHFVTRREFTKSLIWVSLATFLANAVLAVLDRLKHAWDGEALPQVQVATVGDLPVGGSRVFYYSGVDDPCLLVRLDVDRYVAFGQKCTHLGCPVNYRATARRLYCPCHEGFFDAEDGRVLAGPPSRPLPRIVLERRRGELWAVGKA